MKLRYLLSAALLGGIVMFAWSAAFHFSGVAPGLAPKAFADSNAVVEVVRANAPENGIYFEGRGLFAAVAFRPDLGQKFDSMARPMLIQFGIEAAVSLLLAWVLLRLPIWPVLGTGSLFATVAVAAGIETLVAEANWYGFPLPHQLGQLADLVIGWFLLGIVLGWLRNRMQRAAA